MRTPILRVAADHDGPCHHADCPSVAAYITRRGRYCTAHTHPAQVRILRAAENTP
jgi:hypothetical protein